MELVVINSTNITAMTSFANNANGMCANVCVGVFVSTLLEGPCRNYRINAPCIAFNIYGITNGFELHAIHSHSPKTHTHRRTCPPKE